MMQRMKSGQGWAAALALAGMLAVLGLAYGIDEWLLFAQAYYAKTFAHLYEISWTYVACDLLWAGCVLALAWFVLAKLGRQPIVILGFLLAGLLITFYPVLYFTGLGSLPVAYRLAPPFRIYWTGGLIAAIGLFRLILPGPSSERS